MIKQRPSSSLDDHFVSHFCVNALHSLNSLWRPAAASRASAGGIIQGPTPLQFLLDELVLHSPGARNQSSSQNYLWTESESEQPAIFFF